MSTNLGKIVHRILVGRVGSNLAANPLEKLILVIGIVIAERDLVLENQRPDEAQNAVGVAFVDVFGSDVDEHNAFALDKVEHNGQILNLGHTDTRLGIVLAHSLGMGQNLQQIDQHKAVRQILVEILNLDAAPLQKLVAPSRKGLFLHCNTLARMRGAGKKKKEEEKRGKKTKQKGSAMATLCSAIYTVVSRCKREGRTVDPLGFLLAPLGKNVLFCKIQDKKGEGKLLQRKM